MGGEILRSILAYNLRFGPFTSHKRNNETVFLFSKDLDNKLAELTASFSSQLNQALTSDSVLRDTITHPYHLIMHSIDTSSTHRMSKQKSFRRTGATGNPDPNSYPNRSPLPTLCIN